MSVFKIDIKKYYFRIMVFSTIGLAVGFYVLEEMATWEKIPLGQVFYIILGCFLIAVSGIFITMAIKLRFFPKKRKKKGSRPIFLEDEQHRRERKTQSSKPSEK